MTRKRRAPEQLHLFRRLPPESVDAMSAGNPAALKPAATSWVARHWPDLVPGDALKRSSAPSLQLWAESCHHLAPAAREILIALAFRADGGGAGWFNLRALAADLGVSRNKLRRFLDRLLVAGLVMLKPYTPGRMFLGYQFRLVDAEVRSDAARQDGFVARRESDSRLGRV